MKPANWFIRLETAADDAAIEALQAEAFGPGRFARTAFRIREGVAHAPELSLVGLHGERVAGSVRLTPILIGETPSMLLGPLTVDPEFKNRGLGKALLRAVLSAAEAAGETCVLLVGDEPYYGPFGFKRAAPGSLSLPGPVDQARVLIALLNGAEAPTGVVRGGR